MQRPYYLPTDQPAKPARPAAQPEQLHLPPGDERSFIAANYSHQIAQGQAQQTAYTDRVHTALGLLGLLLLAIGAGRAFGLGYALLSAGAVLLSGVIYARTRPALEQEQ